MNDACSNLSIIQLKGEAIGQPTNDTCTKGRVLLACAPGADRLLGDAGPRGLGAVSTVSMVGACGGWRDGVPEYLGVGGGVYTLVVAWAGCE